MAEASSTTSLNRRARRRQETIAEILETALKIMAVEGVAGLNLAEVARRMGMRPPSLYQYFPSKLDVYDALFAVGMRRVVAAQQEAESQSTDPLAALHAHAEAVVRWCLDNPVLSQLMYWRPVPGFEPSPAAFALARQQIERLRAGLREAVDAGALGPEAAGDEAVALFTCLIAGVISQQLANEPDASADSGRFTRLTPLTVDLFIRHYAPKGRDSDGHHRPGRHGPPD